MEISSDEVARRLRECAESRGISQTDVCRLTGFAAGTVSRYFNGVSLPKSQELLELSKMFGVSMEWLLTGVSRDAAATRVREDSVETYRARRRHLEEAARELEEIVERLRKIGGVEE